MRAMRSMKAIKIVIIATLLCFLYASFKDDYKDVIFLFVLAAWVFQCGKKGE